MKGKFQVRCKDSEERSQRWHVVKEGEEGKKNCVAFKEVLSGVLLEHIFCSLPPTLKLHK